jgi:CarboxypepD_reg-like domain
VNTALATTVTVTLLCIPAAALSQGAIRGKVIDSETGAPISGASVQVGKNGPTVKTDSAGKFTAQSVTAGVQELNIRVIGYEAGVFDVRIRDATTVDGVFPLDFNGYELPAVVVEARAEALVQRYNEFEHRRHLRLGTYLRWDELHKQAYNSIGDALRTVGGVRLRCDQARYECLAFMARTPQCQPTWYVDGIEVHSFHESTPISDVYGIEIYRGPGEVPAEFGGSNAACGVIAIWTKSKPYRITAP